jgi:hypothetical protein
VDRFFLIVDDADVTNFQLAYDFHDSDWKNQSPFASPIGLLNAVAQARGRIEIRPSHRSARPIAFGAAGSAMAVNRLRERCTDTSPGPGSPAASALADRESRESIPAEADTRGVAVGAGRYLFDAMKTPAVRRAWQAMISAGAPATLRTLNGPTGPSEAVDVGGQKQELFTQCQAHQCDTIVLKALFDGVRFVGLFREGSRLTEVGAPTDAQRRVLRGEPVAAVTLRAAVALPTPSMPVTRDKDIAPVDETSNVARAVAMVRSGQAVDGFALLTSAAVTGDAAAQANAGQMLMHGVGTPRDRRKGLEWLEKAAAAGDLFAKLGLARAYHEGLGVTMDRRKASEFLVPLRSTPAAPEAEYWLVRTEDLGDATMRNAAQATPVRLRLCASAIEAGHRVAMVVCPMFTGQSEATYLNALEAAVRARRWMAGLNVEKLYVAEADDDDELRNRIAENEEIVRFLRTVDVKGHLQKLGFELQKPR